MPLSDLQRYIDYSNNHFLPSQKSHFYMAQLAFVFAASNGYKGKVSDFLLDEVGQDNIDDSDDDSDEPYDPFSIFD